MNAKRVVFLLSVLSIMAAVVPAAHASPISVASMNSNGVYANGPSGDGIVLSMSEDGRYVAFGSQATNLATGSQSDANASQDVYVRDMVDGKTVLISADQTGAAVGGWHPSISADGRYVAFVSKADLDGEIPANGWIQIFQHDRDADGDGVFDEPGATSTRMISIDGAGTPGNAHSFYPRVSGDGNHVLFSSYASNLVPGDTNGVADSFVRDMRTGKTVRVSIKSDGSQVDWGTLGHQACSINHDGRFVTFFTDGDVGIPRPGSYQSYVHDRDADGNGVFDEQSEPGGISTEIIRTPLYSTRASSISADGRYVLVGASDRYGVYGPDYYGHLFVVDRETGDYYHIGATHYIGASAMSSDGTVVAFTSLADDLVENDTNGRYDAFVHDLATGTTRIMSISDTGEIAEYGVEHNGVGMSGDGRYVSFRSGSHNLVPGASYQYHVYVQAVNSIRITDAIYDYVNDMLNVKATSSLGAGANLELSGYGPMDWNPNKLFWELEVTDVATPPTGVTVCGVEGCATVQ